MVYIVRPSLPTVTVTNPLVDGTPVTTLATCSTSGFRPATVILTWMLGDGSTEIMAETTTVTNMTDNKYAVASQYRRDVSKINNGKTLKCTVNHEALDAPMPRTAILNISCNQQCFFYNQHVDIVCY